MNIVNIRTAPISTIHKGGLEVMSERKKDMTRVKKKRLRIQDMRSWETRHFYRWRT